MKDNKNVKSKIWVYAVVLFMSAFIVLLYTFSSQIKLNNNINNYKTQISSQESEKNKYHLSFVNAQDVNNKLNEENKRLEANVKFIYDNYEKLQSDKSEMEDIYNRTTAANEMLCKAQAEYLAGNTVVCASTLKGIDVNSLSVNVKEIFRTLSEKAYVEAGKLTFDEGYKLYKSKKYPEAVEKFALSKGFSTTAVYSDKCLYYLAISEQKGGHMIEALEHMKALLHDYPKSRYIKSAEAFIKKYTGIHP
jgi:TolA-binding protein